MRRSSSLSVHAAVYTLFFIVFPAEHRLHHLKVACSFFNRLTAFANQTLSKKKGLNTCWVEDDWKRMWINIISLQHTAIILWGSGIHIVLHCLPCGTQTAPPKGGLFSDTCSLRSPCQHHIQDQRQAYYTRSHQVNVRQYVEAWNEMWETLSLDGGTGNRLHRLKAACWRKLTAFANYRIITVPKWTSNKAIEMWQLKYCYW